MFQEVQTAVDTSPWIVVDPSPPQHSCRSRPCFPAQYPPVHVHHHPTKPAKPVGRTGSESLEADLQKP